MRRKDPRVDAYIEKSERAAPPRASKAYVSRPPGNLRFSEARHPRASGPTAYRYIQVNMYTLSVTSHWLGSGQKNERRAIRLGDRCPLTSSTIE